MCWKYFVLRLIFFVKRKTAYEMRISDWSSDVCSSDLLMFVPRTNLTRRQTVERVAFLKPKTSFRSGFAYDNILYAVAGQLIEEVTGQRWEDYMRDHEIGRAHV